MDNRPNLSITLLNNMKNDNKMSETRFWTHISSKFIEKYKDYVNWTNICNQQKLTEQFIDKHADKVDWDVVKVV